MYARGGFCFFSQFCPIKIKKFLTKFLYPIKDIGFLSSNMKRYFTSDYFLLSYGSLKIAKIACSGLIFRTLRITPSATTKITPFEAHFGWRPNTPLTKISTSPKLSNLSWENTKLSCLDEKVLTKPALSAEAMWDRENNSDDELNLVYKGTDARGLGPQKQKDHQYLPEPTFTPVESGNTETATTTANPRGTSIRTQNCSKLNLRPTKCSN